MNALFSTILRRVRRGLDNYEFTSLCLYVVGGIVMFAVLICNVATWSRSGDAWQGVRFHCKTSTPRNDQLCRDAFERFMGTPRQPR